MTTYFEHNSKRIELDVVEWVPPPEIEVEETDDEDTVRIVRAAWLERIADVPDR